MKHNLWILIVFLSSGVFGQDLDHLMVARALDCSDVSYNCSVLFEKYLKAEKTDSAEILLRYWENKCGPREPIRRSKIILALLLGNFHDSLLAKGMVSDIFNYRNRLDILNTVDRYSYETYKSYYGFIPIGGDFDKFTRKTAIELKPNYDPGTMEHLLCEFYGDKPDSVFAKLQSPDYAGSVLSKEYFHTVDRFLEMGELHMSWITGIWIPTGGISGLGIHPELGFQIGAKSKKMNYDLTICFKFGNTSQDYYARRTRTDDSLIMTHHFLGGYIGFDVGYDIFARKSHELQIQAGVGLDGFDAVAEDIQNNIKGESVLSYNFNFGLEHRFYFTNSFYFGLQVKYNIVDYTLGSIVDFTGNPVTVRFILGGFSNTVKKRNLEMLQYRWRK